MFFRARHFWKIHRSLGALAAEVRDAERYMVLLPVRTPPPPEKLHCAPVDAFACDALSAREVLHDAREKPAQLTYYAGAWAIGTATPYRLLIRQIPLRAPLQVIAPRADASVARRDPAPGGHRRAGAPCCATSSRRPLLPAVAPRCTCRSTRSSTRMRSSS